MPRLLKLIGYGTGLLVSTIYLLNPTAGVLELVPDNLPVVGNLDEAAAVGLFLAAIRGLRSMPTVRQWYDICPDRKTVGG